MRIDIATLFPEMVETVLDTSIIGRARKTEAFEVHTHQIRDFAFNKHRRVDDSPYGGGRGMVMQCEPIFCCYEHVKAQIGTAPYVIYMSPKGKVFTQQKAQTLSQIPNIFILCGHYEGVDERVLEEIVNEEISIGDYVLTGGELPACVVTDTILRMVQGVLPEDVCFEEESCYSGLLEYPHYSKPEVWHDKKVPDVLMSGHHANIKKWRTEMSIEITKSRRPDLFLAFQTKK
ncbi:MAG: tRNA (guanosine(37)-N1)-methyltransferase TrmD [Ruminococcus sp.]|jgi:tRNA (guanine37-N1)-methyltransferase|nr:tRNA (guanosine(37)-N1)-methyltransferase TrmD [Ruminococcus sp.]